MPLVPAKCPECGGNINIDPDKKAAVCEFCKQPFVVEEAVQNFNNTYNITNNNEIKADVVNIYNEKSVDSKIKAYGDKISLSLKLGDADGLTKEIQNFYEYTEEHKENALVHEAFMTALIDSYDFVLEGNAFNNIKTKNEKVLSPLKLLINEVKIIKALDSRVGKLAEKNVKAFYDRLFDFITTPISKTNQVDEIRGVYECIHTWGGYPTGVNTISLAGEFLVLEVYPESYVETFISKIRPIINASKEHYLGYEMMFGRFAIAPGYYFDDSYRCESSEPCLLDISVTEISQIDELRKLNKNRVNPKTLYHWEDKVRLLSWKLKYKECYACGKKLSLTGKCKTPGCEYYNKTIKSEISKLNEKIQKAKLG